MIRELSIQNFAIAEKVTIRFLPGLNILTGETGAGKSIIINALMAILGERVGTDVIRQGAESAVISGIFDLPPVLRIRQILDELGIEAEDEIILRRIIQINGKSRAYVNDIPVNISVLKEIGDWLVDIHGQHEHQFLLNERHHLPYLDAFIGQPDLFRELEERYQAWLEAKEQLHRLREAQANYLQKKDFLSFQIRELEEAHLRAGELEELEAERKKLINTEKIHASGRKILALIEESDYPLTQQVHQLRDELVQLLEYYPALAGYSKEMENMSILLGELSREIERITSELDYSPGYQEEIEGRIALIRRLMNKYQKDETELIRWQQDLKKELETLENLDFELQQAEKIIRDREKSYLELALKISELRKENAGRLAGLVVRELRELGMPSAAFSVEVNTLNEDPSNFTAYGLDQVRFLFSGNPGEEMKPLARIASGGEISRLMLSLKKVFADRDDIPTLVFDEIDTGVSGETALAVGKKIRELSRSHQIICITHLPQIASQPGRHFQVRKEVANNRTSTVIIELSEGERIKEIARLIGGNVTEQSVLDSARFLLNQTHQS